MIAPSDYILSRAVADYLASPLNHNEGQDGPDDFDRPQTLAAYSAALSAIAWGVDFAITAIGQIFEAIDLKYESGDGDPEERWSEVQRSSSSAELSGRSHNQSVMRACVTRPKC